MTARSLLLAAALGSTIVAGNLSAQDAPAARPGTGWQFIVSSGKVLPTGAQRDAIKSGNLTAAQLSYAITPMLAITTTVGWARSRDLGMEDEPKLDVFTYDVGAELRAPRVPVAGKLSFSPFAGAGAGARSYNHRKLDVDATHNVAAYASAGGELGLGRVRLRIEARDYVTGFKPLTGDGPTDTRNDVVVVAGLRIVR